MKIGREAKRKHGCKWEWEGSGTGGMEEKLKKNRLIIESRTQKISWKQLWQDGRKAGTGKKEKLKEIMKEEEKGEMNFVVWE